MPRRRAKNLPNNHERWLVSYADLLTLMFAFFVVMYSVSQVSESKYRALSQTLVEAFNPAEVNAVSKTSEKELNAALTQENVAKTLQAETSTADEEDTPSSPQGGGLEELESQLKSQLADLIFKRQVKITRHANWLEVDLRSNILFPSASAEPSLQAKKVFTDISVLLKQFENLVQVEGFTDNVPIHNQQYISNWELSGARAAAVVRLLAAGGVAPQRLVAVGYGEYRPITTNETEAGRAQNRRVVLMIPQTERAKRSEEDTVPPFMARQRRSSAIHQQASARDPQPLTPVAKKQSTEGLNTSDKSSVKVERNETTEKNKTTD